MLLDSSAVVAMILREPGWELLRDRVNAAETIAICAATLLKSYLVLTNRTGKNALPILEAFLAEIRVQVIPFAESDWRHAAEGFLRYGKERHPAALDFGDCIAYGSAKQTQQPLLFKGSDFEKTDVRR